MAQYIVNPLCEYWGHHKECCDEEGNPLNHCTDIADTTVENSYNGYLWHMCKLHSIESADVLGWKIIDSIANFCKRV